MADPTPTPDAQRRALTLFNDSLEKPLQERYEWLADRCSDEPEVLSVVLKLLAADQVEDTVLDQPVVSTVLARAGDRAGPFELIEEIGAGGAGRVFRACRADGEFQQEVAVKLFESQRLSGPLLERFHAERQILASLEHPGIARLIDGGTTDSGLPYVAMELIRGHSITAWCGQHKLDIPSRLALFQKVCDALEVAHARGIVHRDIKPGNVLVGEDGDPKVIDFGIAKVMDPLALGLPDSQTQTRFQALTPEYASPEQVRGEQVSPTTDVYSLGVLLYEMLTGVRPYQISTLSPAEVERTVCHTIPDDPSDRVARRRSAPPMGLSGVSDLKRQLKGDIDRIVMSSLKKEPDQRYQSAAAFSQDIERYLSGHPVHARGASRGYRAAKFLQRHRTVSGAVGAVILALSAALISVTRSAREVQLEANRAEAARSFLIQMISESDPFVTGEEKTVADAVEQSIPSIAAQFADQPDISAELRHTIGVALSGQGRFDLAREQLQQALDYFRVHGPARKEAVVLAALAGIEWDDTDFQAALRLYEQAQALVADDASDAGRTVALELLVDLTGLMPHLEQYDEGIALGEQALAMIEQGVRLDVLDEAVLYNNLAVCFDSKEQYQRAIEAYEKSIARHRRVSDAHPDLAIALGNLGQTYELVGDMESALSRVEESYRMIEKILGSEHPETVIHQHNLGSMMLNDQQYEQALPHLLGAAAASRVAFGPTHEYTGRFHYKVALARQQLGELAAARQQAGQARQIFTRSDEVPGPWLTQLNELEQQLAEPE